jgi:spore coat-associated protein N
MRIALTSTGGKVLASTVLLGAAASVAGLGTFGTFTSTTSASAAVASGTVKIDVGAVGSTANRLSVAATGLVPGDTVSRAVTLTNNGDQALAGIGLTTAATTSSKLDTDATLGLQLTVEACSVPWTESGTATTGYTYVCPSTGTRSTVLASRPVIGSTPALNNLTALAAGKADNLVVKMTLPDAADNSFQALTSAVSFSFTGTQRGATSR